MSRRGCGSEVWRTSVNAEHGSAGSKGRTASARTLNRAPKSSARRPTKKVVYMEGGTARRTDGQRGSLQSPHVSLTEQLSPPPLVPRCANDVEVERVACAGNEILFQLDPLHRGAPIIVGRVERLEHKALCAAMGSVVARSGTSRPNVPQRMVMTWANRRRRSCQPKWVSPVDRTKSRAAHRER